MNRFLLLTLVALAACTDTGGPVPPLPQLSIIAGNDQQGPVMKPLPVQLAASLTDKLTGLPLPGRILNWTSIEGGGSVFATVTQTGSDGIARQSWNLGPTVGTQKLVARWLNPETGETVTLDTARAIATPDTAIVMAVAFGGPNIVAVGEVAWVDYWYQDSYGNPGAPCADGGSWDRVSWALADPKTMTPEGPPIILPNGRHRQGFRGLAAPGTEVIGHPACGDGPDAGVLLGVH